MTPSISPNDPWATAPSLDAVLSRFELAWRSDTRPSLGEFIRSIPAGERAAAVPRLLRREIELRREAGESPALFEYAHLLADYKTEVDRILGSEVFATAQDTGVAAKSSQETPVASRLHPASSSLASQLGCYQILREIARGGMGVVYLAMDLKLDRLAAVKLIKSGELAGEGEVQRFLAEAKAAAQLDHPGVVQVFEVGQCGAQHFMSMAYVDGQSLWQEVKNGPLAPQRSAHLMQQVAEAVQYAHGRGIVHRDLKPQNILLTKDDQPKVTDFGLAKRQGIDSSLTETGQVLGTPSYMPPEQAIGKFKEVGPLADIYSLGATLYCVLTGRPPFQAATLPDTLRQVVEQDPVSPRQLNSAIPKDLETICLKCLEKDPLKRYPTAGMLADDLRCFLSGEPIYARPVSRLERAWRWCRKRPAVAALCGSVILLAVLGVFTSWKIQEAARTRQTSRLTSQVEVLLDDATPEESFIERGEILLTAIEAIAPEQASSYRERMWKEWARSIETVIGQVTLTAKDEGQIENALKRLELQVPEESTRLRRLLKGRSRDWQMVLDLHSPFANGIESFPPENVELRDGRIRHATLNQSEKARLSVPEIFTTLPTTGDVKLEVEFDGPWLSAPELALEFQNDDMTSYLFVMRRASLSETSTEPNVDGTAVERKTTQFDLQIIRNQTVLARQTIQVDPRVSVGVKLSAERQGDTLNFEVIDHPPHIKFEDVFAIRRARAIRFGAAWPAEVGLIGWRSFRKPPASTVSPLDQADQFFSVGDFESALEQYVRAATRAVDPVTRQQAQYKQAVCHIELKQFDAAEDVLKPLVAENARPWSMRGALQLWAVSLETHKEELAEQMLSSLGSQYKFQDLVSIAPDDLRRRIIELTVGDNSQQQSFSLFNRGSKRREELIRARECLRLLDANSPSYWNVVHGLYHAHLYSGNLVAARNVAMDMIEGHFSGITVLSRIQREAGAYADALWTLDTALSKPDCPDIREYSLEKMQCLAALGRWEEWDSLADSLLKSWRPDFEAVQSPGKVWDGYRWQNGIAFSLIRLRQGFRFEELGRLEEANAAWLEAAALTSDRFRNRWQSYRDWHIIRALAGQFTDDDAAYMQDMLLSSKNLGLLNAVVGFIGKEQISSVLKQMWSTRRGHLAAKQSTFEELPYMQFASLTYRIFFFEYLRESLADGDFDTDQDELVWALSLALFSLQTSDTSLTIPEMFGLANAWRGKGARGFVDVENAARPLQPSIRAPAVYLYSLRYRRLARIDDANRLLRLAIQVDPQSLSAKLAERDLAAINEKQ